VSATSNASIKDRIKQFLREWGASEIKQFAIRIRNHLVYRGDTVFCPVCERGATRFVPFGNPVRENSECVWCGAKERHRFVWLFWKSGRVDIFANIPGRKFLHLAPEMFFEQRLRPIIGSGYITADLMADYVDVKMDVQDIKYADNTFDMIYCCHVLEHVQDDRKAMSEFYRTLKPGGWAILMVPDFLEKTVEDPTISDPEERLRLFRQEDHVRDYGADFADRARAAGFDVTVIRPSDILSPGEIEKMVVIESGNIYFCRKNGI
jgi:predicted SAM-dependent methyltransferase